MIWTQAKAKQFFVQKALAQAEYEHMPLSNAERRMLSWSESDPHFTPDPALVDQLSSELSDEQYESKIAGLLARAYERDLKTNAAAKTEYTKAYSVLKQGDHYIVVMIDKSLRRRLRSWWAFWH